MLLYSKLMRYSVLYLTLLLLPFLHSCVKGGSGASSSAGGDTIGLSYAENLTLEQHDGYVRAVVRNPWDTTKTLHTYILVPDSADAPRQLPEGTVVKVPLKKALVYSTVHQSLVDELGALNAIAGICDAQYIHNPRLLERIDKGNVVDCGNSYTPNMERIIQLSPDAVLLSPYENSGNYGKLGGVGIPLIECADYMESSPLGRAEWMKFYGMLFGCSDKASELFSGIERDYLSLKSLTKDVTERPKVIVDKLYGNSWYVPRKDSTMGIYICDAGGANPFDKLEGTGSAGLSGEQVLHEGGDADIWLLRYAQASDKTLGELAADNPIYKMFKPLNTGRVYGCNTDSIAYYEEVPFHPHWLLRDLIRVFHPELSEPDEPVRYFTPLKK